MRWFILLLGLAACDGVTGGKDSGTTPGGCATSSDCEATGGSCFAPDEPNCPLEQSCLGGYSCPTGQWCAPADPAFPICGDSECRPECASDADCRAGVETCDTSTGECAPIRCDAGYTCASHETCDPTAPVHGCVRDLCETDTACDGGYCVNGACYDERGTCSMQAIN